MFWGLSEALDLYQEYLNAQKPTKQKEKQNNSENNELKTQNKPDNDNNADEAPLKSDSESQAETEVNTENETEPELEPIIPDSLNILIFGAGDPRHLIKTLAKLYSHRNVKNNKNVDECATPFINFYMLDGCAEIVARNIVLLGIALENPESINLQNKVHLFMDIYGNTLMRPSSHQYLLGKAKSLLKMLTDSEFLEETTKLLNIDNLKYRERDGLENAFEFLLPKEGHVFNIQEYWNARLSKFFGCRYDHRDGAFDWDLNMVLKEREGKQICSQEYHYWRETGIAFTYPEYEQCKPNKTLAVGLIRNGDKYLHRGYAGDIQTGPFCAFGLKSTDERMLKSQHGENEYRATDITERNLLEYFHELQTCSPYEHNTELSRKYGSIKLLMGKRLTCDECDMDAIQDYNKPWIHIDGVKVHFLSADDVFALQDANGRWCNFFDVAFVGHNYFAFLRDTFLKVLKPDALLIMETKLLTMARKDDVQEFENKLKNFAKTNELMPVINYSAINMKCSLLKFRMK